MTAPSLHSTADIASLPAEARDDLRAYAELGGFTLTTDTHAWYAAVDTVAGPEEARAASTVLAELRGRDLPALRSAARRLEEAEALGIDAPRTVAESGRAVSLLLRVRLTLRTLNADVYDVAEAELDEFVAATANGAWRRDRGVKVTWLRRRSLRGRVRGLATGRPRRDAVHSALASAATERTDWAALGGAGRPAVPADADFLDEASRAAEAAGTGLTELGRLLRPEAALDALPFDELAELLDRLAADEGTLYRLPNLKATRDRLEAQGLGAVLAELTERRADTAEVVALLGEAESPVVPEPRATAEAEPSPSPKPESAVEGERVAEPETIVEPEAAEAEPVAEAEAPAAEPEQLSAEAEPVAEAEAPAGEPDPVVEAVTEPVAEAPAEAVVPAEPEPVAEAVSAEAEPAAEAPVEAEAPVAEEAPAVEAEPVAEEAAVAASVQEPVVEAEVAPPVEVEPVVDEAAAEVLVTEEPVAEAEPVVEAEAPAGEPEPVVEAVTEPVAEAPAAAVVPAEVAPPVEAEPVVVAEPVADEAAAEAPAGEPEPVVGAEVPAVEPVVEAEVAPPVEAEPVVVAEPVADEAVAEVPVTAEPVAEAAPAPAAEPEPESESESEAEPAGRPQRPEVTPGKAVTAYSAAELTALVRWIDGDGEKRSDDELLRAAMKELGFARLGPRIKEALGAAVAEARG
ncbi:hypothetical protein ACFW3D_17675 [Streptomyces sp. NPDC058864]